MPSVPISLMGNLWATVFGQWITEIISKGDIGKGQKVSYRRYRNTVQTFFGRIENPDAWIHCFVRLPESLLQIVVEQSTDGLNTALESAAPLNC